MALRLSRSLPSMPRDSSEITSPIQASVRNCHRGSGSWRCCQRDRYDPVAGVRRRSCERLRTGLYKLRAIDPDSSGAEGRDPASGSDQWASKVESSAANTPRQARTAAGARLTSNGNVQLAGQALAPKGPSSPRVKRDVALGLLAGLFVGLLALFVLERLDATVRDADEAAAILELPLLGVIPTSRVFAPRPGQRRRDG